ncbi:Ig-like V-type domain-containing protein FAM187A [Oreochromis aureus]|uniref:Ig-like domain-containing protein n=1 Tax=Oreochromis aureus TaxID=47969 RepID=A0A668VCI2_OREAU|nr:Ig-like V-type domain-containing protein FAM187A [Oreochromis aureus]XP_039460089.1 Ig-like V-type domain-containing protein FAM187A [Oreochromis aureus]
MPFPSLSPLFLLFLTPEAWSYEAPEDKQDVFARTACPAFLTFTNAAYLSGVTVELPCLCKPEQVQSVVWFFRKHLERSEDTKALTDHHGNHLLDPSQVPHSGDLRSRFSIRLFSLLIFRAGPDDAGVYICGSAHKDFFYGYDLDIQEAATLSFTNRLVSEAGDGKRDQSTDLSALYHLFTSFQPWSVCDRCGVPGEQVRAGLCYIRSRFLNVRYRRANQTIVSCGSGAVPRAFGLKRSRVAVKLEVRSCHMTCPSQAPPSKLLGLMSLFGSSSASLPTGLPLYYLTHPDGQVLTLGCPGARPDMAVAWDRGDEPIYRSEHSSGAGTDLRLIIDTGHHLLFQPAQTQDSGVYYCWLYGRRAAEIHLLVYPHFGSQSLLSHPDFPAAVRTVLGSYAAMTAVFFLLMLGRAVLRHRREQSHVD